jgi:hypothetical protein
MRECNDLLTSTKILSDQHRAEVISPIAAMNYNGRFAGAVLILLRVYAVALGGVNTKCKVVLCNMTLSVTIRCIMCQRGDSTGHVAPVIFPGASRANAFYAAGTTLSANPSIFHKRKFPQLSADVSHAGNSRYCIIDPHHTLATVIVRVT